MIFCIEVEKFNDLLKKFFTEASPAGKFSQPAGTEKNLPALSLRRRSDLVIKNVRVSVGIHFFQYVLSCIAAISFQYHYTIR